MTSREINVARGEIAGATVIAEFRVSDGNGRIAFTNVPGRKRLCLRR